MKPRDLIKKLGISLFALGLVSVAGCSKQDADTASASKEQVAKVYKWKNGNDLAKKFPRIRHRRK